MGGTIWKAGPGTALERHEARSKTNNNDKLLVFKRGNLTKRGQQPFLLRNLRLEFFAVIGGVLGKSRCTGFEQAVAVT